MLAFLLTGVTAQSQTFNDSGFVTETVFSVEPFQPVFLTFAPDGRIFVVEKGGVVRIYDNGELLPTPFIDISSKVNIAFDRGLLGFALDPDFEANGFAYLLYTFENGSNPVGMGRKTARLTRVKANANNPNVASPGSEVVILGSIGTPPCPNNGNDCIPSDEVSHTIGTLRFAPDGNLFVGIGDGSSFVSLDPLALRAQDLNSYSGKILRIKPDGTALSDNPFYDGTNSIQSKVWSYGLRNPYRFSLDPAVGEPIIGDVGWSNQEEINSGKGKNFGWPCYEGNSQEPSYAALLECQQLAPSSVTAPLHTYDHVEGQAVIGGVFYTSNVYPNKYQGNYFFADYSQGWIKRMEFLPNGKVKDVQQFATEVGIIVNLEMGPDDFLYYIEFESGEIRRIKFDGPVAQASATPSFGYSPLNVTFSSAGSVDPTDPSLSYLWDFDDNGQTSTLANPSHSFVSGVVKTYNVTLTVTNQDDETSSDVAKVTVGSVPPVATILNPPEGTVLKGGDVVGFKGSATDPDEGILDSTSLRWDVLFHHDDHIHTVLNKIGGQGSFGVDSDHGEGTFSIELILSATDSSGLMDKKSILLPIKNLLFLDDFADGQAEDWNVIKDMWSVEANQLVGTTEKKAEIEAPNPWIPSGKLGCSSCTIETDIRFDSTDMLVSILGWYEDNKNYVELKLIGNKGKISIKQKANGKVTAKDSVPFQIQAGTTYRLRVSYSQDEFNVYIDDVLVSTASSSATPFGNLRFKLKSTSKTPTTVRFANIEVF